MTQKNLDVVAVCNALVDIIIEAKDKDLKTLGLNKGHMHLVDADRQSELLNQFQSHVQTIELGGSGMNAIRAVASLGKKTGFAGMIGKDSYGQRIKERMQHLGIQANLGESGSVPTGTSVILVSSDGERTMVTCLGASRLYDSSHIPKDLIRSAKIFHFCGYQWDTDNQKEGILESIAIAKKAGTKISFDLADPAVVKAHHKDFVQFVEKDCDIIFANKEEASLLYGLSPQETAFKIAKNGTLAVVKLGAEGALIQKGQEHFHVSAVPTAVVDTTAAGDMFAGGFLYGFIEQKDLATCGRMAATMASDVISRYGAVLSDAALSFCKKL